MSRLHRDAKRNGIKGASKWASENTPPERMKHLQKTRFGIEPSKSRPVPSAGDGLRGWNWKTCQYIEGEPLDPMCGKPTIKGSAYCQAHHEICWTRPPRIGAASVAEKASATRDLRS